MKTARESLVWRTDGWYRTGCDCRFDYWDGLPDREAPVGDRRHHGGREPGIIMVQLTGYEQPPVHLCARHAKEARP